jgi:hypothetical protein
MGSGNSGVQGASATASELVVMAAQVLDHPELRLLRAALAHTAGEVIRTEGDQPVLQAIELAPDLAVAQTIRAAAEAACESVSVSSKGKERRARLFSVPVVVRFAEPTTTQEFDETLTSATWSAPFLARLHECGARHSISCILPHVFLFEDLANLSFGSVRNGTIMASATSAQVNACMIAPFPMSRPAQRRSATFLRYLVGCQVDSGGMADQSAEDPARFGDCVRSVMRTCMMDACDVAVVYTGHFYEAIWQGLWVYHLHRLAEVARTIAAGEATPIGISASIAMSCSRHEMAAHVAFRSPAARHDVYSLPISPLQDPQIIAGRIAAVLRTLGVKLAAEAPRREVDGNVGMLGSPCRAHRKLGQFCLRLPL